MVMDKNRDTVHINGKTSEDAKHLLKTQMNVAEKSHKHCEMFPIHGPGQGAGDSPGIWCCMSSVIFNCHQENAHGATFQSPDGRTKCRLFVMGFADDTSGSTDDFTQPTKMPLKHCADRAAHEAQRWNDCLHVTGAALNKLKCSHHFVVHDFTLSGLAIAKEGQFKPKINIRCNKDADE